MARQENPTPGTFLFGPVPAVVAESHYALADDLPIGTVHVSVPAMRFSVIRPRSGPLVLTGILSLGGQEEPTGRISWARLTLDDHLDALVRRSQEALRSSADAPQQIRAAGNATPPDTGSTALLPSTSEPVPPQQTTPAPKTP